MSGSGKKRTLAHRPGFRKGYSPENILHAIQKQRVKTAINANRRKAEIEALRSSVASLPVGRRFSFSMESPKRGPGARGSAASAESPAPSAAAGAGTHEPKAMGTGAATLERFRQILAERKAAAAAAPAPKKGGRRQTQRKRRAARSTRRKSLSVKN